MLSLSGSAGAFVPIVSPRAICMEDPDTILLLSIALQPKALQEKLRMEVRLLLTRSMH